MTPLSFGILAVDGAAAWGNSVSATKKKPSKTGIGYPRASFWHIIMKFGSDPFLMRRLKRNYAYRQMMTLPDLMGTSPHSIIGCK